ncbi:MAG: preprotein translocase subunit YajC [Clostridia bacterium]
MENLIATAVSFAPIILMVFILYFFMIKPQKRKEKSVQDMRNALEVGDYVTTIGGVIGRVVAVREDQVTIESGADRVKLHFAKWAIQGKTDAAQD